MFNHKLYIQLKHLPSTLYSNDIDTVAILLYPDFINKTQRICLCLVYRLLAFNIILYIVIEACAHWLFS
jgi:hypothetical protein